MCGERGGERPSLGWRGEPGNRPQTRNRLGRNPETSKARNPESAFKPGIPGRNPERFATTKPGIRKRNPEFVLWGIPLEFGDEGEVMDLVSEASEMGWTRTEEEGGGGS